MERLLTPGLNINYPVEDGKSVLFLAVVYQRIKAATFLIAHGAMHGMREIATQTSSPLITTLPASPTPIVLTTRLRRAIDANDLYAVQTLLAKGTDVNAPDVDGSSPFAIALRINSGPIAPTPPNPAILETLFKKGAHVNESDPNSGRTLLIRVVLNHQPASLNWLLVHGANVKIRDSQLRATALNYADDPTTIRALLQRGANIDSQDREGYTDLMTAARDGKTEAVHTLITLHAHVNLKSKQRETALSLARTAQKLNKKQDRSAIIRLLKQAGAK